MIVKMRSAKGGLGIVAAGVAALNGALADLGDIERLAEWDGSEIDDGTTVEEHDAVAHNHFGFLPLRPIPWINRPTYHLAVEVQQKTAGGIIRPLIHDPLGHALLSGDGDPVHIDFVGAQTLGVDLTVEGHDGRL